jgi:TPR repeat protein
MKKFYLLLITLSYLGVYGQQPAGTPPGLASYNKGIQLLDGSRGYDPAGAFPLLSQSAAAGNVRAMNALGNMYANGMGMSVDADKAIYWYKMAAKAGYANAWYNLGRLYQTGDIVAQDFIAAAGYYQAGANAGDKGSRNWLAYMYYKGLGLPQSYPKAFALYSELAQQNDVNAWYFLGICYRNGYGVAPDADLAKQWLMKAADKKYGQAIHELTAEPLPENASVFTPALQEKVQELQNYHEQFTTAGSSDISGTYKGYAVYYDFSRQFVHEIVPLNLQIDKNGTGYEGVWTEGDSLTARIKASFTDNLFQFDSSSKYTRRNYYSYRDAEPYRFNSAALSIKFFHDSIYLSGDVQFYSILRKEPGQPIFISLSRAMSKTGAGMTSAADFKLALSPNPTQTSLRASFTLPQSGKVQLLIADINGKILQQTAPETLPPGSFQYSMNVQGLAAGTYVLTLNAGSSLQTKTFIKL